MTPSYGKWVAKSAGALLFALNFLVFALLDCVDRALCPVFRLIDLFFEGECSPCYCSIGGEEDAVVDGRDGKHEVRGEDELSESLSRRDNVLLKFGFQNFGVKCASLVPGKGLVLGSEKVRWSDCGCETCVSWISHEEPKLHVVVKEPSKDVSGQGKPPENVIFLHGFLASSSLWTETVFRCVSESGGGNYRLFAVDLLGFGMSPKPRDCLYTIKDHLEMIEKSLIRPFQLDSFHIVGHSMGCIIAMALASKYEASVKSVILTAPPYLPCLEPDASLTALRKLAGKALWPPLLFGSSIMSWYEHVGRCICFIICRNHRTWERIIKFITRKSDLPFRIIDLTKHTHHSAWHTMHNVICGGAKLMDGYLERLRISRVPLSIIHGDRDQVVPLECSIGIKSRIPEAEVNIIPDADHTTVILGRELDFLQHTWESFSDIRRTRER